MSDSGGLIAETGGSMVEIPKTNGGLVVEV